MDAPADDVADLSFDQLMELDARAEARDAAALDADTDEHVLGASSVEPVVLPWWQHPVNIITIVITAALLAAMIGWMVGDNASRVPHNDVDTGFLQDMREHHEQAVYMSFIFRELDDTDPGLRTIAASIARGQSLEVGRMIQLLRDFGESEVNEGDASMLWMGISAPIGQMHGMASDEELEQLSQSSGAEADALFVRLMTDHHIGGIEMADFAAENGLNDEVLAMAASMAAAQRGEIAEMEGLLD